MLYLTILSIDRNYYLMKKLNFRSLWKTEKKLVTKS